jgi:hypothetical protein
MLVRLYNEQEHKEGAQLRFATLIEFEIVFDGCDRTH